MDQQELLSIAFKMTVSLGVVLLVFGGAIFLVKKFSNSPMKLFKKTNKGSTKPLEVLAYQSLGPGRGLYLLRCLDKKILIGSTSASIQHLTDVIDEDDDEFSEEIPNQNFKSSLSTTQQQASQSPFEKGLKEIARV